MVVSYNLLLRPVVNRAIKQPVLRIKSPFGSYEFIVCFIVHKSQGRGAEEQQEVRNYYQEQYEEEGVPSLSLATKLLSPGLVAHR